MATELLNALTVVDYLLARKVIKNPETVSVEELSGGVSNVVLGVRDGEIDIVLKQALPELKVQGKWVADQRRAIVEAKAIDFFHSISPAQVPRLIDADPERFTLVIDRAPRTSRVWKSELLAGRIDPSIGGELGKTLASWHRIGAESKAASYDFEESSLFEQLRITPFYREVASKNPDLARGIDELIREVTEVKETIVHGDFSPKNFLVDVDANSDNRVYILDFEVAHYGNPIFDLAFVLAHLLCKFFRTPSSNEADALKQTAATFLEGYAAPFAPSLYRHLALIALARVEGLSRVDYLDAEGQEDVRITTKSALSRSGDTHPLELFERIER